MTLMEVVVGINEHLRLMETAPPNWSLIQSLCSRFWSLVLKNKINFTWFEAPFDQQHQQYRFLILKMTFLQEFSLFLPYIALCSITCKH